MVLPPFMRYPNKKGCAVETLVTIIGEKNEEQKKIDLDILSGTIQLNFIDKILFLVYRILKKLKISFLYFHRYYYKIFRKIVKENYDYVIFEAGDLQRYQVICKKLSSKIGKEKMIHHMHMVIEDGQEEIVETFGKFIGVSNFLITDFKEKYEVEDSNLKVLANCTTENEFHTISAEEQNLLRTKLNIEKDDFVVLFVGRLVEDKGIYELVEAIKALHVPRVKLLILGSTFSENSKETKFSKKLKDSIKDFEGNIIFTGHVSHEEIYKYYQIANIQVIPTICEEAAGLVAIEGMLCGLPIIATKSGGMIEYIDDKCAKIIEKDEKIIENLKESILELYNDCEKCKMMSEHAINRAKKFTMQKYYDDFVKIMEEWERK